MLHDSPGMDVLAVREATRFAIDYCSVQKKVGLCAVQCSASTARYTCGRTEVL